MNPNDRRTNNPIPQVAGNVNGVGNARPDVDVEFGDFEGFEDVAVMNIPAAAGPSPWATFPDLLRVQTSPPNPSDEPASANPVAVPRGHNENEPWLIGAIGGVENPIGLMNPPGYNPGSARAVNNPPDISLISACCTSPGGAPFNGLDPVSGDPRQRGIDSISEMDARHQREGSLNLQVSDLQQHVEALTSQRSSLEQQLADAIRERQRMAESLRESASRVNELQAQQRQANHSRLEEAEQLNANVLQQFTVTLQQIRESVESIQQTQAQDRQTIADLQENLQKLSSSKRPASHTSEGQSSSDENNLSGVQESASQNLEQIIQDTVTKCLGEHKESNVMEQCSNNGATMQDLKAELHVYTEQIQEVMETERRNYKTMISRSLQTALKQLSSALNSINLEEDNCKASKS